MWLFEFVEGHLHGVTLPIDPKLVITGSNEDLDSDTLYVPEVLSAGIRWVFSNDGKSVFIRGLKKGDESKKLRAGYVYRMKGVAFFVYRQGEREPQWMSYCARKYRAVIILILLLNIALAAGSLMAYQANQETYMAEQFTQLNGSYIKNGKLKVPNASAFAALPLAWQANAEIVKGTDFQQLSQPVVEVVSSYSKKTVTNKIIENTDRDQIQVETFEADNRVMAVLGEYGLAFNNVKGTWFVSDSAKAIIVLRANGLQDMVPFIAAQNERTQLIDNANFPYSIFYSSTSRGYLYDDKYRYWVGSNVPHLGVIQSISADRVVFKDSEQTRVYFIQQ
ncbi:hypothetical protein CKQ84_19035 [Shewanella sp. WE21]|jgi:hypothetical protein|uniref:hypothetical protein n=1 Tax=Shewanella sp. WE21 TaxID=2029986 RepID=UPI000CF71543|nr:hypothetical protein [Shewanella sp. WE21]AVI67769.1 hypothetical protein CKQ84_19035 [Shewanella sp. WE21]